MSCHHSRPQGSASPPTVPPLGYGGLQHDQVWGRSAKHYRILGKIQECFGHAQTPFLNFAVWLPYSTRPIALRYQLNAKILNYCMFSAQIRDFTETSSGPLCCHPGHSHAALEGDSPTTSATLFIPPGLQASRTTQPKHRLHPKT